MNSFNRLRTCGANWGWAMFCSPIPYGGRKNMTPQRLELVKQAGYCGCLSAYGGVNVGKVDRYNVLRRGIHWEYTDRVFLFTCFGFR